MNLIDILLHYTGLHVDNYITEVTERQIVVMAFFAMLIATAIHSFGHAWMADKLGDPTPRAQKRVTLSPFAHLDPLGILVMIASSMIGLPIGWGGRPVRMNPENFRIGPKRGLGLVAAAGPIMNLLTAVALAPLARYLLWGGLGARGFDEWSLYLLLAVALLMLISLSLGLFNLLIPVAPLDGCLILASVLPDPVSKAFRWFMARFGSIILIALMSTHLLTDLMLPLVLAIFKLLIGIPL